MASLVESPLTDNPFSEPGVPSFVNPPVSFVPAGPVTQEVSPLTSNPTLEAGIPQLFAEPPQAVLDGGPLRTFVGPLFQPVTQSGPAGVVASGGGGGPSPGP